MAKCLLKNLLPFTGTSISLFVRSVANENFSFSVTSDCYIFLISSALAGLTLVGGIVNESPPL